MIEQITITIDKDIARMLATLVMNHGDEWRRRYDDQRGLSLHVSDPSYFRIGPSLESRQAWLELLNLLEEKAGSSIPVTY